jgi:hypothetical protein
VNRETIGKQEPIKNKVAETNKKHRRQISFKKREQGTLENKQGTEESPIYSDANSQSSTRHRRRERIITADRYEIYELYVTHRRPCE